MIFFNRQWHDNSERDRILAYLTTGQALFETMFYRDGILWFWERHLQRLRNSLDFFGATLAPLDLNYLIVNRLSEYPSLKTARIKLVVLLPFLEQPEELGMEHIVVQVEPLPRDAASGQNLHLVTFPSPFSRSARLTGHKTTNYGYHFFYRRLALMQGGDDVLYVDEQGNLLESSIANIFGVRNGEMVTPPQSLGLLPGTVRSVLLDYMPVQESAISLKDIENYDYFFLTGSVRGVRRVRWIDDTDFGEDAFHFEEVQEQWSNLMHRYSLGEIK